MCLRHTTRRKDGKTHVDWRLVRSVRHGRKLRQETVAQLGALDAGGFSIAFTPPTSCCHWQTLPTGNYIFAVSCVQIESKRYPAKLPRQLWKLGQRAAGIPAS